MIPFPDKKYQIIYADPPWHFKQYNDKTANRWVGNKYPVMNIEEICSLPVQSIADINCILFMWAISPMLPQAIRVINAWGFTYKTRAFCWIKKNKKSDSLFWGTGYWTRANAEDCLLATRGKPERINGGIHSIIMSPVEGHSVKPHETRERIISLVGDLPRIELFARQKTDGWDVWGNEV